jgi:hypothetical protein
MEGKNMIFSKRIKLVKEYKQWVDNIYIKEGFKIQDCSENLIAFLDARGLLIDYELKEKEILKKQKENIGKMVEEFDKEEKILREYFLLSNASKHINCESFNNCKHMRPCVSNIMICSTFRNYLRKILNDKIN